MRLAYVARRIGPSSPSSGGRDAGTSSAADLGSGSRWEKLMQQAAATGNVQTGIKRWWRSISASSASTNRSGGST